MAVLPQLIVLVLVASATAVPFMYYDVPTSDDNYASIVDKLKNLIQKEGHIDPTDIKAISSLKAKNEWYRSSYKATFTIGSGKECYYKWREVLYALTFIAEHNCILIPKVLPPRIAETTTTEEPTTTTEELATTTEELATTTEEPATTNEEPATANEEPTTVDDGARAVQKRKKKKHK